MLFLVFYARFLFSTLLTYYDYGSYNVSCERRTIAEFIALGLRHVGLSDRCHYDGYRYASLVPKHSGAPSGFTTV
jgi:hypothetical protein